MTSTMSEQQITIVENSMIEGYMATDWILTPSEMSNKEATPLITLLNETTTFPFDPKRLQTQFHVMFTDRMIFFS